jgi:hypothetical protein
MRFAAAVLLAICGLAGAQEKPAQFAHGAAITVDGAESHYRFSLPAAAYMGVARRDLADVRVFNGAGEAVPYAFVPARPKPPAPKVLAATLFPLYGEEAKGLDALDVRVERTRRGTVVHATSAAGTPAGARKLLGYFLDLGDEKGKDKPALQALILEWSSRQGVTGFAHVEGSDDLKRWTSLASGAPVLVLEHEGARLEQKRVELGGARARYLRLSFTAVPQDFNLKGARLELRAESAPQPERDWFAVGGAPDAKRPGDYVFDTGGHFPIDRLRFALPQVNTVAQVRVFVRERVEDPWRPATSAVLYRLRRDSRDIINPDVDVHSEPSRYWLLRVDQRGGGLGAGEVRLEFGWVPHELVFAARGAPPFSLAYGLKVAKPGAMALATVLPGYKPDEPISAKTVAVSVQAPLVRERASLWKDPGPFARDAIESGEAKKWALWAALVVGVLVLGWMAFGLLRQVGKASDNPDSR